MIIQKLRHLMSSHGNGPVFVIGTGRSGTHWLARALDQHPDTRTTFEAQPMFQLSTNMALNPALERKCFSRLVAAYRWELFKSAPSIFVDKSHPNIWLAEKLLNAFPHAKFLGIERNPYATVASMMKHRRVAKWHARWREFPVPNRFLGITAEIAEIYDSLSIATQCAIRWKAHKDRMTDLRENLNGALHVVSYESLAKNTTETAIAITDFLELRKPLSTPDANMRSINKWKNQLAPSEIEAVRVVVDQSSRDPSC